MKRIRLLVPLFCGLSGVPMTAQTTTMTANIPFNFEIGKGEMPAGNYRIDFAKGVLWVQCREKDKRAAVLTSPKTRDDNKPPTTGVLQFHRYGNTYFLAAVWTPDSATGGALAVTPHERELAKQSAQPASIALRTGK